MNKQLVPTTEMSNGEIKRIGFDLTLIIDKDNNLVVINTKEDGDWKDYVDCNTLTVKHVKIDV